MKTPVSVCENERCEKTIFKGEKVWHKGHDLYCSSKCLIESFGVPVRPLKLEVLREKEVLGGAR